MNNLNLFPVPVNVLELVKNIKYCVDQDCLLKASFFKKEILLKFTNGKTVENFGSGNQYFVVRDINIKGISLGIGFSRTSILEKESGNLVAHFDDRFLNVDDIIKLFGSPEKIENPYRNILPAHLPVLEPKTHKLGYSEIHQTIIGENSITKITTLTLKDGSASKLNVEQIKVKK